MQQQNKLPSTIAHPLREIVIPTEQSDECRRYR